MNKLKIKTANSLFLLLYLSLNSTFCFSAETNQAATCKQIKKFGKPSVFLVDKDQIINKGPINFGKHAYSYNGEDYYTIPTGYRIIVSPAKLKINPCLGSCLVARKITPICPGSSTYEVSFKIINKQKNIHDTSWLPFKIDAYADLSDIEDPDALYPIEVTYNFEKRIIGELYNAK